MEKELVVNVNVSMRLKNGETEEQAKDRFYDQLWSGVCGSEDFGMEFEYQDEGKFYEY